MIQRITESVYDDKPNRSRRVRCSIHEKTKLRFHLFCVFICYGHIAGFLTMEMANWVNQMFFARNLTEWPDQRQHKTPAFCNTLFLCNFPLFDQVNHVRSEEISD